MSRGPSQGWRAGSSWYRASSGLHMWSHKWSVPPS
jgi:hypothetical protein